MDPTALPHADEAPERPKLPGDEIDYDVMVFSAFKPCHWHGCPPPRHAVAATHINIQKNAAFSNPECSMNEKSSKRKFLRDIFAAPQQLSAAIAQHHSLIAFHHRRPGMRQAVPFDIHPAANPAEARTRPRIAMSTAHHRPDTHGACYFGTED